VQLTLIGFDINEFPYQQASLSGGFMNIKKTTLALALGATVGVGLVPTAFALTAGSYDLVILTTPVTTDGSGYTGFKLGAKDGAWQSSFTFGGGTPSGTSQGMTDTAALDTTNIKGSGVVDGFAGKIAITLNGDGTISGPASFSGTWTAGGAVSIVPTGRLGSVSSFPGLADERWNVDNVVESTCSTTGCTTNSNTTYGSITTASASTSTNTINGTDLAAIADVDGDAVGDWSGILVSGGTVGADWGNPGFANAQYFEVWRIQLLSKATAPAGSFSKDTIFGTAGGDFSQYIAPIPIPAAVWLFGSGLLGLVGVARRKAK
jgi:hypothetical protein